MVLIADGPGVEPIRNAVLDGKGEDLDGKGEEVVSRCGVVATRWDQNVLACWLATFAKRVTKSSYKRNMQSQAHLAGKTVLLRLNSFCASMMMGAIDRRSPKER